MKQVTANYQHLTNVKTVIAVSSKVSEPKNVKPGIVFEPSKKDYVGRRYSFDQNGGGYKGL